MNRVEKEVEFGDFYKDKDGFMWRKLIIEGKHRHSISDTGLVYNTHSGSVNNYVGKGFKADYKTCTLSNGKRRGINTTIHKLVATAFKEKPESSVELVVDHIDEDKHNNKASNLQWVTRQKNTEKSLAKNWVLISPSGIETQIYNLEKFCRENSLDSSAMYFVANRLRREYRGWTGVKKCQ